MTYPVNKLLLTGDPADMPHVEELMQQEFAGKLSICRSAPFFIETMPLGVGKDTSLEILLRAKGLTPANLMACGDGWNDLPMIRLAGMGVAMGNARPRSRPQQTTRPPTTTMMAWAWRSKNLF